MFGLDNDHRSIPEGLRRLDESGFKPVEGLANHLTDGSLVVEVSANGEVVGILFDVTPSLHLKEYDYVEVTLPRLNEVTYRNYKETVTSYPAQKSKTPWGWMSDALRGKQRGKEIKRVSITEYTLPYLPYQQKPNVRFVDNPTSEDSIPDAATDVPEHLQSLGFRVVERVNDTLCIGSSGNEQVMIVVNKDKKTILSVHHSMSNMERDLQQTIDDHLLAKAYRFDAGLAFNRGLIKDIRQLGVTELSPQQQQEYKQKREDLKRLSKDEVREKYNLYAENSTMQWIGVDDDLGELIHNDEVEAGPFDPTELAQPLQYAVAAVEQGYGSFLFGGEQYFVERFSTNMSDMKGSALVDPQPDKLQSRIRVTVIRDNKKIVMTFHQIMAKSALVAFFESPNLWGQPETQEWVREQADNIKRHMQDDWGWEESWTLSQGSNPDRVPPNAIIGFFKLKKRRTGAEN